MADLTVDSWGDVQRVMPEGVTIDDIFPTACPVQIVGDIVGEPFYFRARGCWISLGVGGDPVGRPDWEDGYQHGQLGTFSAGRATGPAGAPTAAGNSPASPPPGGPMSSPSCASCSPACSGSVRSAATNATAKPR